MNRARLILFGDNGPVMGHNTTVYTQNCTGYDTKSSKEAHNCTVMTLGAIFVAHN